MEDSLEQSQHCLAGLRMIYTQPDRIVQRNPRKRTEKGDQTIIPSFNYCSPQEDEQ